ncbi:MAG TPA: cation transporter dimerization domain-containing protein [Lachnospiraceae bacterium]|nr:cation transporter dimerization domain-containing protein [Lachnospiraceae bacterium]
MAFLVALLIIKEAWHLSKGAFDFLIDVKLSDEEEAEVIKVIEKNKASFIDYHKLKTRESGSMNHIDFHITLPEELPVGVAHDIIGNINKDMSESLQNTRVSIHSYPYVNRNERIQN